MERKDVSRHARAGACTAVAGAAAALMLVLLVLVGAGCGLGHPHHAHHLLNEASAERGVDARVGDTLTVLLAEVPGPGYRWESVADGAPALAQQPGAATREGTPADTAAGREVVGGPRTAEWTYLAQAAGQARLRYLYRRPWESEVEPARTCEIAVRIKP